MGANCCGSRPPEVANRALSDKLLKDERSTMASANDGDHPHDIGHGRDPSITESSYDAKSELPIRAATRKGGGRAYGDDDEDPFASPRHFVNEHELSFKSGTSQDLDHDRLSYGSSISSLNGSSSSALTPKKEADSYEDSSARFRFSSQKFDEPPKSTHGGWDI
ncbi:Aste57867_8188 [Aphanomyces stellatus]|uniref:Aste57867_8188 protein n=1 Tax=Aphanomyces stellatus TaxID=120398 RepID=A0A485KJM2_9STRA|nr:hypothetical protein As57867_008157 [Aphanomyces stellatus]VFT85076.1 Aste57867_8188 [Aphanomyces stellatus]